MNPDKAGLDAAPERRKPVADSVLRIKRELALLGYGLLDLVYPRRCAICRRFGPDSACERCVAAFERVQEPVCFVCGRTLTSADGRAGTGAAPRYEHGRPCAECAHAVPRHFEWARAAGAFSGSLREAVHRLKYDGRRRLGPILGCWARSAGGRLLVPPKRPDLVAPVPLHWTRARQRGFNQSLLIAQGFVGERCWPISAQTLKRVRRTRPQVELDAEHRARNVANAFAVADPESVRGKRVLVVDDVVTTLHTVNECARVLTEAGARAVYVVSVAG